MALTYDQVRMLLARYAELREAKSAWFDSLALDATRHPDLREFSKTCPDPLMSSVERHGDLWLPKPDPNYPWYLALMPPLPNYVCGLDTAPEPEPEFEVNLTEPLVGWRAWGWNGKMGRILSLHDSSPWVPLRAKEARCDRYNHLEAPTEDCTCGIYAMDDYGGTHPDMIYGRVYGWGRYVRGDSGWRAQFAYPKMFLLESDQEPLVEPLKQYGVPIRLLMPVNAYDPVEDGYDEYRQEDPDRNCGAVAEPDPAEAPSDQDDED